MPAAAAAAELCAFCHDILPTIDKGRSVTFKHKSGKIVAHTKCLQFSSNLYEEEDDTWDTTLVYKELARIKKLVCATCKKRKGARKAGAGAGCANARYLHKVVFCDFLESLTIFPFRQLCPD